MLIHSGEGEIYGNGKWNPILRDNTVFIPPNEEHAIRNTGKELLVFACIIPSGAPEL